MFNFALFFGNALTTIGGMTMNPALVGTGLALTGLGMAQNGGDSASGNASSIASQIATTNAKNKKSSENKSLIGLKSPVMAPTNPGSPVADIDVTFDITSYIDKALLKLHFNGNLVGFALLREFSVRGKQVIRHAGDSGYRWEYYNYSDIDRSNEVEYKVGNNFITTAAQCEDIGDYVKKELLAHDMYDLTIHGIHPYLEVGQRWELNIDYTLPGMQFATELISVDVEIRGVSMHRAVGQIGETILSVRVPSGEWNNTTPIKASWIANGAPQGELNRSNIITIGAYDYAGQADIYCDGVDDDVEIQAVIDQLSAEGGGMVQLSRGHFLCDEFYLKANITLTGEGRGTIVTPQSSGDLISVTMSNGESCIISNITIDGNGTQTTYGAINGGTDYALQYLEVTNVHIINYALGTGKLFSNIARVSNCSVYDIDSTADIIGYYKIGISINNNIHDVSSSISGLYRGVKGFHTIGIISSCECYALSDSPGQVTGFTISKNISSCKSSGNTAYDYIGFSGCSNITVCESSGNAGSSTESGFYFCKSVQQCHTDDTTKYNNSYADAGTSNACDDTPNGGFNS